MTQAPRMQLPVVWDHRHEGSIANRAGALTREGGCPRGGPGHRGTEAAQGGCLPVVGYTRQTMSAPGTPASSGWFITIEGPEGGGKTTQAERLRAHLAGEPGAAIHVAREPGGTWLGERVRAILLARTAPGAPPTDPLADAFLFNAARRQLVREVIRPALDAGTTVICARFADSTLAYQGHGAGVSIAHLRALAELATDGLTPDLTIVLDLPVEAGLARKAPGDVTRFEAEFDLGFHRRVRDGFLALAAAEPARFAVIDATLPMDQVTAEIVRVLDDRRRRSEPESSGVRITT